MNHAERVKELVTVYLSSKQRQESGDGHWTRVQRDCNELHKAIDAMQSALDDAERQKAEWSQWWSAVSNELDKARGELAARDAEVELVARVLDGETSFPEVLSEEVKGGE